MELELCNCCKKHPEEADKDDKPVECIECGELCQCTGCIVDHQLIGRHKYDAE